MVVIAVTEMFAISGRQDELATLLERFERWAGESRAAGATHSLRNLCLAATANLPLTAVPNRARRRSLSGSMTSTVVAEAIVRDL